MSTVRYISSLASHHTLTISTTCKCQCSPLHIMSAVSAQHRAGCCLRANGNAILFSAGSACRGSAQLCDGSALGVALLISANWRRRGMKIHISALISFKAVNKPSFRSGTPYWHVKQFRRVAVSISTRLASLVSLFAPLSSLAVQSVWMQVNMMCVTNEAVWVVP